MKKILLFSMLAMFMTVGCEEAPKSESPKAEAVPAKPVEQVASAKPVEQPVAVAVAQETVSITDVDWNKALEMQKAGAALIDVRTPGEFAEGSVPGAVNIALQEMEQRLSEFPKDKDLVIFCRSGRRSMAASNFLLQNGYTRVFNVVGGILAYRPAN